MGLIGLKDSGKEIFLEFLKKKAIETEISNIQKEEKDFFQYFIVFEQIPISIKVYLADTLKDIIYNHKKIKKLDVLILALNLYNLNSKNKYNSKEFEEFRESFTFKGPTMLIGFDTEQIFQGKPSKNFRISRFNLIQKAKELDLQYCFEIQNDNKDTNELFNKLINDFILIFNASSPGLLEKARIYGKKLISLHILA